MTNEIDKNKSYGIDEALVLMKENCNAKFDTTVELHVNLGIDPKKQDQGIRTTTVLPHGTGKSQKVAVLASKTIKEADVQLNENELDKLENGELKPKVDFDVIVTEPKFMPKLGKYGKVLGPAGVMPNPKTGTVTEDVEKAVEQIKKGKVELRTDPIAPIVHTIIGKRSFTNEALKENYEIIMNTLKQSRPQKVKPENYIQSVFLSSTMSPSIRVAY